MRITLRGAETRQDGDTIRVRIGGPGSGVEAPPRERTTFAGAGAGSDHNWD